MFSGYPTNNLDVLHMKLHFPKNKRSFTKLYILSQFNHSVERVFTESLSGAAMLSDPGHARVPFQPDKLH